MRQFHFPRIRPSAQPPWLDTPNAWDPKTWEGFPLVKPTPFTGPVTRNLIYHCLPYVDRWQRCLDKLKSRLHLFNGCRTVAISTGANLVPAEEVREYLGNEVDYLEFQNDQNLREVVSFVPLLETVETLDPNQITFYAHTKGVTHQPGSICWRWGDVMWDTCTREIPDLISHAFAGAFRCFGMFNTWGNHRWHYSGTFYWFRNAFLFARNWRRVDQMFFGAESYPASHFRPEECQCLFMDHCGSLYDEWYWRQTVEPEYEKWKSSRTPLMHVS